ncbi:MAG: hypothetical protein ACTHMM_26730 [Agriterribacter sp.]
MKTIIIPFNGSTDCIALTETILSVSGNENLNCIFLSVNPLPDNYNDLFSLSRSSFSSEASSKAFYGFSAQCKARYGAQVTVTADHIYSDSCAVFRNYVQHKNADMVVFDTQQWEFSEKRQRSVIFKMLSRCGCELLYVSANKTLLAPAHAAEAKEDLWEKEEALSVKKQVEPGTTKTDSLPHTVVYQYSAVDEMLNEWENNLTKTRILSKPLGNMSRYFLKEVAVQRMLEQSQCSFVLLKQAYK